MLLERLPEVQALSADDKWRLIDELWSDLARELESAGPDSNVVELLEERFSDYLKDPSQAQPLDVSLARFVERKRRWK
jgi:putative addiction module component (TIGR02574 family)